MTALAFTLVGASPNPAAMTPVLDLDLRIEAEPAARIQSIMLRCQFRIEPELRGYSPTEEAGLGDLFGEPERWGETLTPFLLTHATLPVRGFRTATDVTLPLELSYDLEVAAGKYLHALRDGEIPLLVLFSRHRLRRRGPGACRSSRSPGSPRRATASRSRPGSG